MLWRLSDRTLYPYTTLFRSAPPRRRRPLRTPPRGSPAPPAPRRDPCRPAPRDRPTAPPSESAARAGRDRKSTRLNSSHVETSYAVFCLKKKTTGVDIVVYGP